MLGRQDKLVATQVEPVVCASQMQVLATVRPGITTEAWVWAVTGWRLAKPNSAPTRMPRALRKAPITCQLCGGEAAKETKKNEKRFF